MIDLLVNSQYVIDIWMLESVVWSMADFFFAICSAEIKYKNHNRINSLNDYV
jgi:hypothetical protein